MINALPSVGTDPVVGLKTLCDQHPGKVVFTTSMGLEDQALTDLIARNAACARGHLGHGAPVPRDLRLDGPHACDVPWVGVRDVLPGSRVVGGFVNSQGMSSIFKSVEARRRAVASARLIRCTVRSRRRGVGDWLRSAQSDNRAGLSRLERDAMSGKLKYNPLLDWTDGDLDTYVNSHSVPTNLLHRKATPPSVAPPAPGR